MCIQVDIDRRDPEHLCCAAGIVARVHADVAVAYKGEAAFLFTNTGKVPVRLETLSVTVNDISKTMVEAESAREGFELRDIRRTCESMLAAIGASRDIRAQILSHGLAGVQVRHYDRHDDMDEKRAALDAWDARLKEIADGKKCGAELIELRFRRYSAEPRCLLGVATAYLR